MKPNSKPTLPADVSLRDLCWLLGVTRQRIDQLTAAGVVEKTARGRFALGSVPSFIKMQREGGAGTYAEARTQWMQEKAAAAKLDRIARQGKLVDVDLVQEQMLAMVGIVRQYFLGTSVKLAPRLAGIKSVPEMQAVLETNVREILTELSDVAVRSRIRRAAHAKRGRPVEQGDDDDAAA